MLLLACVSCPWRATRPAFGGATEDLLKELWQEDTTPPRIQVLIKNAGADISAKNNEGKTVLDYADNDEVKRIILNVAQ